MKRSLRWLLPLLVAICLLLYIQYPKLSIVSGYAAKNLASTVFLTGRSAESVNSDDHKVPFIEWAKASYRATEKVAMASVLGLKPRKAICSEGLGCMLLPETNASSLPTLKPIRTKTTDSLPYPFGSAAPQDTIFPEIDYEELDTAIQQAFSTPELQRTRTLLVLYKDHLLAERYVSGFGPDTPVLGWSMTKSVLATLFGIQVYKGQLDIGLPTNFPGWAEDARREITFEQLLRMQSGLEWDEDYSGLSDVNRMLFQREDMAKAQWEKRLVATPGTLWNYSSGTSNLLSGLLRSQFDSDQAYLNFPYHALIDRIGMHSMVLETDLSGNFVGSSYGWASTRDWARFGLLYLRKGDWNGERIFHPQWEAFVRQPTEGSGGKYGAHFWLNKGDTYPDAPDDMYMANGFQGQHVFIIPSLDLVVVRTGLAEAPDFDANAFLSKLIASIRSQ
jgi:CubicO group peptidase (beta-lactamase class C family)